MMQDARIRKDGAGSTIIAGWLNREPEGVILGSHPFFLVNWPLAIVGEYLGEMALFGFGNKRVNNRVLVTFP